MTVCHTASPPAGGGHFAALLPTTQPRLRAEQEGEEGREEQEEEDSKPRDPMFGKWIQAQASLHKSVEESFSEQVMQSVTPISLTTSFSFPTSCM